MTVYSILFNNTRYIYNMYPIVEVQIGLIRYLQQWSMDPCGKSHMCCMWDPFGSLWATHKRLDGPRCEKTCLRGGGGGEGGVANNKGADQPALLLCLISPFVVRYL